VAAEDRLEVVRALVARPALEDPELTRVVETDVERAVASFGESDERPVRAVRDRAEARVDRVHEVARDERLPALVGANPVRPLLVGERPGRAERHDEDRRLSARGDKLVLDDTGAHGEQERERPAGAAVLAVD